MGITRSLGMEVDGRAQLTSIISLPADYWQEENTLNYFIEEETGIILTLQDL